MKQQIKQWAEEMVSRFCWLTIKYEFSKKLGTYLISFSPSNKIDECDEFNVEALRFADKMNDEFGDDAPLFTDEENLFPLSGNAHIVSFTSYSDYKVVKIVYGMKGIDRWDSSRTPETTSQMVKSGKAQTYYNIFELAA